MIRRLVGSCLFECAEMLGFDFKSFSIIQSIAPVLKGIPIGGYVRENSVRSVCSIAAQRVGFKRSLLLQSPVLVQVIHISVGCYICVKYSVKGRRMACNLLI